MTEYQFKHCLGIKNYQYYIDFQFKMSNVGLELNRTGRSYDVNRTGRSYDVNRTGRSYDVNRTGRSYDVISHPDGSKKDYLFIL